ncbi:hypothetical protein Tco_0812838 [Tanacetum coccineum]
MEDNERGRGVKEKQHGLSKETCTISTSTLEPTGIILMGTGTLNNSGNRGNGDGDSANVGQTCPNSTSDDVVPISTPTPVWVKLYAVHVTAFSEDGLSAIATKLDFPVKISFRCYICQNGSVITPLMLDSYISDICMQSWGMSIYARAIIELRADVELKDNIVAAMPKITGEGYYTCSIRV